MQGRDWKQMVLAPDDRLPHSRTKQFQMSTHCQPPSRGVRYGTRGTPIGIMRVTCRLGPLDRLLTHKAQAAAAREGQKFASHALCRVYSQ